MATLGQHSQDFDGSGCHRNFNRYGEPHANHPVRRGDAPVRRLTVHLAAFGVLTALLWFAAVQAQPKAEQQARWWRQAQAIIFTRDDWGIAHVRGKTDADALFGMIYAQAEDDFNRVERNYLLSLGRMAEAEGEAAIWLDLRQKLFLDPQALRHDYAQSPAWLKDLMDAWADGLNYYLATIQRCIHG